MPFADPPVLLLFRRDLRLHDQPALSAAVATGRPVVPVFVLDDDSPGIWKLGGAQRWWLHHSLASLAGDLGRLGGRLVLRRGPTLEVLRGVVAETGATALFAGQPVEPWARRVAAGLDTELGIPVHWHRTLTLFEPDSVRSQTGGVYGVFTPFANACRTRGRPPTPLAAPAAMSAHDVGSEPLDSWRLLRRHPDWAGGFRAFWTDGPGGPPGEAAARAREKQFGAKLEGYGDARNSPGIDGTSALSPRLHWGEISAGSAWHEAERAHAGPGTEAWITELLWREFSSYLLWHHPTLTDTPLRPAFAAMKTRRNPAELAAWQRGRTGVPIVDAGMRQLWHTGWMHNRVRMIVASFLVKHLLLRWQEGTAWFWDTLVDADLASNSAQWQWVAGSGADAAPFFRVFNPVLQGRKFDPDGAYVRAWVPELARLPDAHLHAPWEAPGSVLEALRITLGTTYPRPIVDLAAGRTRALAAFREMGAA